MRQNQTIRTITGSFLLLIFVISFTPKRFWHDVFAPHKDSFSHAGTDHTLHISKASFNCDWNMQVATSPFLEQDEINMVSPRQSHNPHFIPFTSRLLYADVDYRSLRGPPTV